MEIKFLKRNLSIIIIMTIIISTILISKSEAVETVESGRTLLNYVDVGIKAETGKELKLILTNYSKTAINKVKVLQTNEELKIEEDSEKKAKLYSLYRRGWTNYFWIL